MAGTFTKPDICVLTSEQQDKLRKFKVVTAKDKHNWVRLHFCIEFNTIYILILRLRQGSTTRGI